MGQIYSNMDDILPSLEILGISGLLMLNSVIHIKSAEVRMDYITL